MTIKRRFTEKAKDQLVKDFQISGVSANAFCKTRNLSASSFSFWRKRLTSELKVEPTEKKIARKGMTAGHHFDFIPVALLETKPTKSVNHPTAHVESAGAAAFEMLLPSGSMIRFAVSCPPALVTAAFAAIGVQ